MTKDRLLKEGDVIQINIGMEVYAKVPRHFLYFDERGCWDLDDGLITIDKELDYFKGKYIVYKTSLDGGGRDYDDGHHVFCKKEDDPKLEIHFYQTGSFTAMIKNIEPIGRAKLTWVIKE